MGGTHGEIRGTSKIQVYLDYVSMIDQVKETFESHDPDPKYKKECKRQMIWDPSTGEWVLLYRLHT
jgi:hypothetical protein